MVRLLFYVAILAALIVFVVGSVSTDARDVLWQRGPVRRLLVAAVLVGGLLSALVLFLMARASS